MTDGIKYGADFLAYEGEPTLYHAKYLVKVIEDGKIKVDDMIVHERMSNTNKKLLLLAYSTIEPPACHYIEISYK